MHKSLLTTALFVAACSGAAAYAGPTEKYGDWTFSALQSGKDRMADASVASNSSEKLHKQCSTTVTGCIWFIAVANIKCAKGEEFPFLANSHAGSASFKAACFPTGETTAHLMILGDAGWIDEMAKAGTFAFAFPSIQTPAFKVAIFSGNGAAVALKKIDEFSAQPFKQEM